MGDSPRIYCIKLVVTANCPKKENGRNPTIKCYRKNWTVTANCGLSRGDVEPNLTATSTK